MLEAVKRIEEVIRKNGITGTYFDKEGVASLPIPGVFFLYDGDMVQVTPNQVEELERAYEECPEYGKELFAARQRKMRPLDMNYSNIDIRHWSLFDACGEEVMHMRTKKDQ